MDNATKALVMAGGVLISAAVISVALYFYTNLRGYASSNEDVLSATQINSFNRFYTAYSTYDGKIRVVDALNILNRAVEDGIEHDASSCSAVEGIIGDNEYGSGVIVYYEVAGDDSKKFLDEVSYSIEYSKEGQVSKVRISN